MPQILESAQGAGAEARQGNAFGMAVIAAN
jgi:hypothetical protein